LVEGRSPFAPDHEHLHHLLVEAGLSRRATLVCMFSLAAVFVSVGLVGDALALPDGVLLLAWLLAGISYYWMMRNPLLVVRLVGRVLPRLAAPAQSAAVQPVSKSK
jgi:UDP-GlcNAc:undecaprenyl-phosphate GlcNAc-1-phosphate transferase